MKKSFYSSVLFFLFLFCEGLDAQRVVTGVVTDGKEPLIGATVIITGKIISSTFTDIDGKFQIAVPDTSKRLKISALCYLEVEVNIPDSNFVNITLKEDNCACVLD